MASPVRYSIGYSFSAFQANSPSRPLPAPNLDMELANISASTESLRSAVADIRRSDGKLANSIVSYDALAPEIRLLFNNGAVDNATLLAEAVETTADNVTAAQAAQVAAEAAAAIAQAAVDPAPLFAGSVVPEIAVTAATTTDIGAAASAHVAINGGAVITSFGSSINRLRIVRFNGVSTLTHSAGLRLLGGRNRTTDIGAQGIYLSDASGNWRELSYVGAGGMLAGNPLYFVEHFPSVVGNNMADDMAGLQGIIDLAAANGGGRIVFTSGRLHRAVSNSSVTDLGLILKAGVTLDLNGATINLECTGQVYGVRPLSHTRIFGPGSIKTAVSAGLSSTPGAEQAIWHAPGSLGAAYGDGGTVGAVSPYLNVTDIIIDGVTFESVRNNGQGSLIQGYGGMSRVTIRNCNFPDNATIAIAIGFDWAFVGNISSGDLAGNKTRYNAVPQTAYTVHPHDITIENNTIGRMTMPLYAGPFGSHGIRMSGCYGYRVVGNDIAETTFAGVFVTGGDLSFEYALAADRYMAMKSITIENNILHQCNTEYGIYYEAYPDNVFQAVTDSGNPQYPYAPMFYYDGYQANTRIVGNTLVATTSAGASVAEGIYVQFSKGCHVADNSVQGFKTGIRAGRGAVDAVIERNSVSIAAQSGILVHDTSSPIPAGVVVRNNRTFRNCVDGGTQGNICVDSANLITVAENTIGSSDEDNCSIGINITATGTNSSVRNNRVRQVKSGGTAYKLANSSAIDAIYVFHDNEYDGLDTFVSGLDIVPVRRFGLNGSSKNAHYVANRSAISLSRPAFGTFLINDVMDINGAASAEAVRILCTASGSQGTWAVISTRP